MFFGRTDARAETPVLWPPHAKSWRIGKESDAGRDWGQEEKEMTEDEMAGWHHQLNGHEFAWTPGVGDGQGGLVCYNSWGRKELDTTEQLNWTELTSITSHIHNWVLFLIWLHLFILSGVISPLFSSRIPTNLGNSSFSVLAFLLFILFMGFSRKEYWSVLSFPSPGDHVLSELSTMTHLSWVVLHSMAHSFIDLDKAVVHVISLVSFLWLWFSFCLPSNE